MSDFLTSRERAELDSAVTRGFITADQAEQVRADILAARGAAPAPGQATIDARAKLDAAAAKRPHVSEATLDRLRVHWQLCELVDAGIVRTFYKSAGRTIIDARGWQGERAYRTTRELEAFVHGAQAASA